MSAVGKKCIECELEFEKITTIESGDYCDDCHDEFVSTCVRCETEEHIDHMTNTDMGYICEGCMGDLK